MQRKSSAFTLVTHLVSSRNKTVNKYNARLTFCRLTESSKGDATQEQTKNSPGSSSWRMMEWVIMNNLKQILLRNRKHGQHYWGFVITTWEEGTTKQLSWILDHLFLSRRNSSLANKWLNPLPACRQGKSRFAKTSLFPGSSQIEVTIVCNLRINSHWTSILL